MLFPFGYYGDKRTGQLAGMKPELEYVPKEKEESFNVKVVDLPYYPTPWHYHPEYELVLILESTGKRFVCDKITDFKPGDIAMFGPLVPHVYQNGPAYYSDRSTLRARSVVVHFTKSTFGENFSDIPETACLQNLFDRSMHGLNIVGDTNKLVAPQIVELCTLKGFAKWLKLLEILNIIAESRDCEFITDYTVMGKNGLEAERLNKVIEFVKNNFSEDIYISDAAKLVNMAENSFSRYFSKQTGKTFASFVTEIRLNHASRLLIDNKSNISEIGFKCGFNNLSNFNRQFSKLYQVNPHTYRKQHLERI